MSKLLTARDKQELNYLRKKIEGTPYNKAVQKTLLDAIESGIAESCGVSRSKTCINRYDTMRKIPIKRKIGFLQRENGSRNGEDFYFSRSYRVRNITYYLDSLFNLTA